MPRHVTFPTSPKFLFESRVKFLVSSFSPSLALQCRTEAQDLMVVVVVAVVEAMEAAEAVEEEGEAVEGVGEVGEAEVAVMGGMAAVGVEGEGMEEGAMVEVGEGDMVALVVGEVGDTKKDLSKFSRC